MSSSSSTAPPVRAEATIVPATISVSGDRVMRSVSSLCPRTSPSIMIVLSSTTEEPSAGTILISPSVVIIFISPSPAIISSAAIAVGMPHSPEPSPSDIQA